MEHSEKYLQAKWVTENPKGYDERDVARANSYCEAYLEGYNQALSIANVVGQSEQFSLADMKKAYEAGENNAGSYTYPPFEEWFSKR